MLLVSSSKIKSWGGKKEVSLDSRNNITKIDGDKFPLILLSRHWRPIVRSKGQQESKGKILFVFLVSKKLKSLFQSAFIFPLIARSPEISRKAHIFVSRMNWGQHKRPMRGKFMKTRTNGLPWGHLLFSVLLLSKDTTEPAVNYDTRKPPLKISKSLKNKPWSEAA